MNHCATPEFWAHPGRLPSEVRELADKNFALLKASPHHPSLRFKKIRVFWSVRVWLNYRALAKERADGLVWYWIGPYREYDQILKR
jgi:hypothetical protein